MSNAVTKRGEGKTIKDLLSGDEFRGAVQRSLPKHLSADRFVRVALTTMTRQPKLASCDQSSFFNCLLTLSQLGLEPDGRRAHLIPFENRKQGITECQLIVDYKGIAELVMRSGLVSKLHADVVCENDEFEYDRGELKRHKIDFKKPRGAPYAAYSLVTFRDGTEKCEVMGKDEIEAVRRRSRAGNNGPWVTDAAEMWKKTVFRRQSKLLPLSPELRDAVEVDDDSIEEQRFAAAVSVGSSFEIPAGHAPVNFGPVEDEIPMGSTKPAGSIAHGGASPAELEKPSPPTVVDPAEVAANATDVPGKPSPESTAPIAQEAPMAVRSIQDDLASEVAKIPGATYDTLHAVAKAIGWFTEKQAADWQRFDDISDSVARKLYGARVGLAAKLKEAVDKGIV